MKLPEHLTGEDPLTLGELGWLLIQTSARRRKLSKARLVQRPTQSDAAFAEISARHVESLAWARQVEDHLILLLAEEGDEGRRHFHNHHLARLRELEQEAAA